MPSCGTPVSIVSQPKGAEGYMNTIKRIGSFLAADHRYVFLGTSVIAAIGLAFSQQSPTGLSVLVPLGLMQDSLWLIEWAWLLVSAVALVNKIVRWRTYATTSVFVMPTARCIERICSYVVWICATLFVLDRGVLGFVALVRVSIASNANPAEFLPSLVYMTWESRGFFVQGVEITIGLAVLGTCIAFVLAILMVFLRIQHFDRSDNDLVRFFKSLGTGFSKLYSTVVRGTPMMVQGLLVYYAGFAVLRAGFGMDTSQANQVWTTFMAGVVTISLNSTAYMMEVLRGGIESVDSGQTEAARSLGLSQWQAMIKVVFPQGVKNSIPALSNELIINIKDSSVLSIIGVFDLMNVTNTVAGMYYRQMEVYFVALLVYLCLTLIAGRLLTMFSRRLDVSATTLPSSN